jgi:hypothetical protein
MGITECCIIHCHKLSTTDLVSIFGILVNAGLAFWIVNTIQKKVTDRRILKDHFINEIKEIRNDFTLYLTALYRGQVKVKEILPWFKLMNIKINDLTSLICQKHKCIDKDPLSPYQIDLANLITESKDFNGQYKHGDKFVLSEELRNELIVFQQNNHNLFNTLIIKINDSK